MKPEHSVVLKVGGQEIVTGGPIERLVPWIAQAVRRGERLVLVHGGGEEVTERASALGLPTEKRLGQRVTSAPMLEVVLEVLGGRINARLVAQLQSAGVPAVGLSGASGRLLTVRPAGHPPGSLGFVGEPTRVRTVVLESLLDQGFTPIVAPIGIDVDGQLYNVNADLAASAIAAALRSDLCLVTDVPGVRDRSGALLSRLTVAGARRLVALGVAHDGMVPKLLAAERALTVGSTAWIGDLDGLLRLNGRRGTRIGPARREANAEAPRVRMPLRGA